MSNYFMDLEFIESGPNVPIYLISIGIVAEDTRTLYIENKTAPITLASEWVKENVVPNLTHFTGRCSCFAPKERAIPCPAIRFDLIGEKILEFIGDDTSPKFWAAWGAYDWVCFCQIFGTMESLPERFPYYVQDVVQWRDQLGIDELPFQDSAEHNALNDALWVKDAYEFLKAVSSNPQTFQNSEAPEAPETHQTHALGEDN